jgi:hypothetical protein
MIVATVLKSGGEYNESHVAKLKAMIDKYVPHDLFVCLTDMKPDCRIIDLQHGWPGWWSKMELFKLCGPVLYFDLDTIILKNMADILRIVRGKKFVILRDFYRGFQNPKAMQSSVMYWEGDMSPIYTGFKWRYADPLRVPEDIHGDQKYLEQVVNNAEYWQDFTSGIVSYKCDVLTRGASGKDVCIVFHGKPRPWQQKIISY